MWKNGKFMKRPDFNNLEEYDWTQCHSDIRCPLSPKYFCGDCKIPLCSEHARDHIDKFHFVRKVEPDLED